jgi:hypothetical protein
MIQLEKINEDKTMAEIFWRHPRTAASKMVMRARAGLSNSMGRLKKRSYYGSTGYEDTTSKSFEAQGACLVDRELEAFDQVEW